MPLLEVRDLRVQFGATEIIRGIDLDLNAGETLGVVGESGCGKSMTGFALMGMVPSPGVTTGSIKLNGKELVGARERDWRQIRGQEVALVMQDPFTSLNPMMRIGSQISESLRLHSSMTAKAAWDLSVELLDQVGVPAPDSSARKFPHQMSGGQRQRVVIAMAFAAKPKVLIADEPTTALDVTLQAQILRLLVELQAKEGTAVVLISHDIGAIGSVAHRISVFYAGRVVESGPSAMVLRNPQMPYTTALLGALPTVGKTRLEAIPGFPPNLAALPVGCSFAPRCPCRFERCDTEPGLMVTEPGHSAACWLVDPATRLTAAK